MYYGVNALIIRMGVAVSAAIISLVQTITRYKPVDDPALMPPSAVIGFRLLVSIVPAVLIGLGLIFVLLYPCTAQSSLRSKSSAHWPPTRAMRRNLPRARHLTSERRSSR